MKNYNFTILLGRQRPLNPLLPVINFPNLMGFKDCQVGEFGSINA